MTAVAQWKESQAAPPPEAAAEPAPEPSSAGAPAQEILSESETEIEVQIGEALYLVDLSAEMVFQILPEEAEVGRWDAASRTIVFDDGDDNAAAAPAAAVAAAEL